MSEEKELELSDEYLQSIIDADKEKWASYNDFLTVNPKIMGAALDAAGFICYDAVNLIFELHSSTSGMYPSWHIKISPSCTAYLDRFQKFYGAIGKSLNSAFADMILKIRKLEKEMEIKKVPNDL